jgi:hypothetical protein
MIIPIGIDCGLADLLRFNKIRTLSLPFDWIVTYNGVTEIIKNNFKDFFTLENNFNSLYHFKVVHEFDKVKYERRIKRLFNLFENQEELIFFRKGHALHNHSESSKLKNDILDCEELSIYLKTSYPKLKFNIIVVLVCGQCFDLNKEYNSEDNKLTIYNISTSIVDNDKFKNLFRSLFNQ